MYCMKCGKPISEKMVYCPECGALQKTVKPNKKRRASKKKLWCILIPCFVVLCVCIGILIFYLLDEKRNPMIGEWTLERINDMTLEDIAQQGGADVDEVKVNLRIQEDKIYLITPTGDTGLDMVFAYKKINSNVLEAYPYDTDTGEVLREEEKTMIFRYDESTDKITMTNKKETTENNVQKIIFARETDNVAGESTSIYQEQDQKQKEWKDLALLDTVYSAFTTAVATLGIDVYDSTELSAELNREMEELLGQSVEDIKRQFVSGVCKGQDLYFYADNISRKITVSVGNREGLHGKASDVVFCAGY